MAKTPAWQRAEGKNPKGGLNEKGRASLRAEGHDIKRPQPEGGSRRDSFCARMKGMKKKLTLSETANDPDSRINKSLRAWNCADGGAVDSYNAVQKAARTDPSAPYGVVDMGDKIIVGSPHGEQIPLSDDLRARIQDVAGKSGAWYEGSGGDIEGNRKLIPSYRGSWDDQVARSIEGYPVEYMVPMFSNVEVNKPHEIYASPDRSIFDSIVANQDKAKYFKDRRFDADALRDFLTQGSEKDTDLVKMSQLPATKENLSKFFSTGERLMWPDNWQEYPNRLGKMAKRFEESRNKYLLNAPPGVYVTGAGHIPELRGMNKDLKVIGGERASEADGGPVFHKGRDEAHINFQVAKPGPHTTQLGIEEPYFRRWLSENQIPFDPNEAKPDYDMRGYYRAAMAGDPRTATEINANDHQRHFPDVWKTPSHETFSAQSQYATPNAPDWNEQDQLVDKAGRVLYDERMGRDDGGAVDSYAAVQEAAKGGEVWDKPRPKKLGKPEPLSSKEKASAKAAAKAAGRPYPNLIDNMRAARADGGEADPYESVQQAANPDSGMERFSQEDINRAAHGATPAVPPLTVIENAAPASPVSDAMRGAYNAAVPPTARLFAESAMGAHSPITERDFSPSDIQNMKDRLAEQQQFNARREKNLQTIQDTMTPEAYRHYQAMTDQPIGSDEDYRRYMAHNAEAIKTFQDTRGQTGVPYGTTFGKEDQPNQPLSVYSPEQGNLLTSLQRSYTDPGYRTGMTLGRFNVYDTPQGRVAVDNYDFRGRKQSWSDVVKGFQEQPFVTALRGSIPTVFPNIDRPVAVNLDKPGNYTYTGKAILTPGSYLEPEQTQTPKRDDIADYRTKTPGFHQFNQIAINSRTPDVTVPLPPRRPTSFADGGEVIGDKVEGDVQFAEDDPYAKVQEAAKLPMMAQNDFAMRMPQPEVRYDTGPQPGEATLKGYEPTIREQIAQKLMGEQSPSPERRQFVEGLMGTSGIGERSMGVADFIPLAGQALQAQESYQYRDPKGFLLATVPVPGANIEGKIAQGAAAAAERAMVGQAAQQMTKSQSQAAMKQAWETGQGNADKYRNWQHQWNVEQGPQYTVAQPAPAAVPAMGHNMPPETIPVDYNRIVNPAGFYSLGHEVASTQLPDTVRTWQEMQSLLKKGGVKDEEMQFAGLLGMNPATKISRDEIAQAFERNFPQVETVWKRSSAPVPAERINQAVQNRTQAQNDLRDANTNLWNAANPTHQEDPVLNIRGDETPWSLPDLRTALMNDRVRFDDLDEHVRGPAMDWQDAWRRYQNAESQVRNIEAPTRPEMAPKWEKYTHSGGTDYSESVLRLPYNNPASFRHIAPEIEVKYSDQHAALKEKLFNLKESYQAQRLSDNQQFNAAMDAYKQRFYDKLMNEALESGWSPEDAMRHAKKFVNDTSYSGMANYLGEPYPRDLDYMSPRSEQLNEELYKTREEIGVLTNKMLDESRALAGHPSYTEQVYRHESHLGNIDNPLLHQRWKERVGPEGERILSNEEFQSDLGQEGAERGFKDPTADKRRVELERQRDALQKEWDNEQRKLLEETNAKSAAVMRQKRDEIKQVTDAYNQTNQLRSAFDAYNEQLAAIDDKYAPLLQPFKDQHNAASQQLAAKYKPESKRLNDAIAAIKQQGDVPLFPHVGSTDQWVELGAKHALQHALESGHDKIFIMGGQEQARRWQSGLRQAVDNIRWEGEAKPWKGFGTIEEQDAAEERFKKAKEALSSTLHNDRSYDEIVREFNDAQAAMRDTVPGWGRSAYDKPDPEKEGFRTVYAKPSNYSRDAKFVIDRNGNIIDSSLSNVKGKKLKDAVGGDLAKRIMSEESGNIPMKNYVMGAEGYTQHYERKVPSIYKDIIKKYLKVNPKVEAGAIVERGVESNEIPPWGQLERLGYGKWKINFPDGSFRDDLSREKANRLIERGKQNFEAMGRTWESKNVPPIEGPHGTYIHITPEMREAYQRIKKERGSVFPGYAEGGAVVNGSDPYDNMRSLSRNFPRARRVSH
jgi:hypothetical protein